MSVLKKVKRINNIEIVETLLFGIVYGPMLIVLPELVGDIDKSVYANILLWGMAIGLMAVVVNLLKFTITFRILTVIYVLSIVSVGVFFHIGYYRISLLIILILKPIIVLLDNHFESVLSEQIKTHYTLNTQHNKVASTYAAGGLLGIIIGSWLVQTNMEPITLLVGSKMLGDTIALYITLLKYKLSKNI